VLDGDAHRLGPQSLLTLLVGLPQVLVYVDLPRALADGIPFFESANGVLLSSGVDGRIGPEYIRYDS
jgi:RNA:NAD 2'-phosphotransferase (TPT1/KptA family)